MIVSTELSGKIDTSKWNNQANIVTPEFKRAKSLYSSDFKDCFDYPSKSPFIPVMDQVYKFSYQQLDAIEHKTKAEEDKSAIKTTFMKNLSSKFDTNALDSTESEETKPIPVGYEEESKLDNTKVSITDEAMSSGDEELTDDEHFLERHKVQEAEEVKRYNIGLKDSNRKDTKKGGFLTPKQKVEPQDLCNNDTTVGSAGSKLINCSSEKSYSPKMLKKKRSTPEN